MIELFFIFKSYRFLIYLVSIFLVYFTKCYRNIARFYLQKIQNQLEAKGTMVVCVNATCCRKLPLILIGKYIRPACFANQTCPLNCDALKFAWMELVQGVFYQVFKNLKLLYTLHFTTIKNLLNKQLLM